MKIQMCDLVGQYRKIQPEVDGAISQVINSSAFINGPQVKEFKANLEKYTGAGHVIPCANGTDALQIALMALGLQPGDEVIVPAFTYVAAAEVIALLKLVPVMVDVDRESFNITPAHIEKGLSSKTKAMIPVHLFGQSCPMEEIMDFAQKHHLFIIEDNAQAIGAWYTFSNGSKRQTGTIGHIGCTSFFPTKNLGCFGDGGALTTEDDLLAERLRMMTVHGQAVKYHHEVLGCNSRLDTLQAAILNVKLRRLDEYTHARQRAAKIYSEGLKDVAGIALPGEMPYSTHVYHQYTLKVKDGRRNALKAYLSEKGVPSMIYYPLPLNGQNAFKGIARAAGSLDVSKELSDSVLSLPMHTELTADEQGYIIDAVKKFFR
ncbi:MAG: DegT/DnrJ/EryC1/StrS family aminotransferase [Bacteroidales bacterium]|jgi:dTDP-4-amino-4,6-dideoxygalactose transaminase|nr:DegT/DnrJ/EryC1/StrS family aminotransferase [Bacteroidales bacterium]